MQPPTVGAVAFDLLRTDVRGRLPTIGNLAGGEPLGRAVRVAGATPSFRRSISEEASAFERGTMKVSPRLTARLRRWLSCF
jgi:hypothetical protein